GHARGEDVRRRRLAPAADGRSRCTADARSAERGTAGGGGRAGDQRDPPRGACPPRKEPLGRAGPWGWRGGRPSLARPRPPGGGGGGGGGGEGGDGGGEASPAPTARGAPPAAPRARRKPRRRRAAPAEPRRPVRPRAGGGGAAG